MPGALEGLKVVELRQGIAAAYCGMLLGDMGAQVVMVKDNHLTEEDPPPDAQLYLDRNKLSILLDMEIKEHREVLDGLVGWADVVIEELLPQIRTAWNIDPQHWCQRQPSLIYGAISPFGRSGLDADRPASDLIVQARSGFMSITGLPDNPYTRSGTSLSEYYTGVATGIAVLAALRHRDRTGEGQMIDMSLFDTLLTALDVPDTYLRTGEVRARTGNMNPALPGYGFSEAADGFVATATPGFNIWPRFCIAIDRIDLVDRPQFNSQEEQNQWGAMVGEAIREYFSPRTRAEIVERLIAHDVPAAPVNTLKDAVAEPPLRERGMLVDMDHPERGRITITGSPLHMTETPGTVRRPAPVPGQDTAYVLQELLGWPIDKAHLVLGLQNLRGES